ncbi:MAG: hypothetical protein CVT63_04930 [Candidatus Anoxymicrobium japonicum]|uniref:Zinc-ribbon domain-containing protein n=1 Tax=Candidatus Anoxymicrobium japonicum TaxID=2013648 RepID=A0A2N3G5Y9_9ACTN|nr:MAG: hypothetical protein CVT63_04930 [Candidatus Anoxymicrobium japonicum]
MICPTCGAENAERAQFCNLCFSSIGFESPEYTSSSPVDGDGIQSEYPSSFREDARPPEFGGFAEHPSAPPVDIGQYGVADQSQVTPEGRCDSRGYENAPSDGRFLWPKAVMMCIELALIAGCLSMGLELLASFLGVTVAVKTGSLTLPRILVMLAFLIPVSICGFLSGYRLGRYEWALGVATVTVWAFLSRPMCYAILAWILSGGFAFMDLFNRTMIAFILFLFLPAGAILGWLGEKRATTGLVL